MNKKTHLILSCLVGVVVCLVIAGIEARVTAANTSVWYYSLNKPSFILPPYVFAPVWTALYIMIGIAGGLIWHHRKKNYTLLTWFALQLFFNFLWPLLFFAGQSIGWALIDIVFLWITLLITLIHAYRHYKSVAYWLIPYFFWVSFAMILNFSFWILN